MLFSENIRIFAFATISVLIPGCFVIPIPSEETVVFGDRVAYNDLRSRVNVGETLQEVKTRLGEPIVDLGPGRVLVYQWTVKKGNVVWIVGGGPTVAGGIEPLLKSHLFLIAFTPNSTLLKAGTTKFNPFDSITKHVREWLSANGLTAQVMSQQLGLSSSDSLLYVYRPSSSPCPFPTFDPNIHKPSVAIDGLVVGDISKGEYLSSVIRAGEHGLTFDPYPNYRIAGQESSWFVDQNLRARILATLSIIAVPGKSTFIEAYTCTGMGENEMHAIVKDAAIGLKAISDLKPAW